MFKKGYMKIDGMTCTYSMKHFEAPSEYGIDGGRISKLSIEIGDIERIGYDRGWYKEADASREGQAAQKALARIIAKYN